MEKVRWVCGGCVVGVWTVDGDWDGDGDGDGDGG